MTRLNFNTNQLQYKEDLTQWANNGDEIFVSCILLLTKLDDPSLIDFIEKQASVSLKDEKTELKISISVQEEQTVEKVEINGKEISSQAAKEIRRKIKHSNPISLHNSTTHQDFYFGRGRSKAFYDIFLSSEEQRSVSEAEKIVQKKIKKVAKEHKDELNKLLGKLTEKYDVEFATVEGYAARRMPLSINLKDKQVEVPLNDWGSGTQNRTHILISILQANRIKRSESSADKITPIVLVEEPESFLHPSAQAEFGTILQSLSEELDIQIIVSTHSPYMLNQVQPDANILLRREVFRKKLRETRIASTIGENWMAPFAENLGIIPPEFESWQALFSAQKSKVLLVEGEIDKEYIDHMRNSYEDKFGLASDIEVVPYGGKDTLKNTLLVKFVLSKFEHVFITYDLDVASEIETYLKRLGLLAQKDYAAVGINKPGRKAIEGLLPDRTLNVVNARETDLVMQMANGITKEKNSAKSQLKNMYLEEFKETKDFTDEELKLLFSLGKKVSKAHA